MDKRFHRKLHFLALWRHDLVVVDRHRPLPFGFVQFANALAHDPYRLAHLLHADEIAVVAIAVLADRNVEIHLRIALVGLRLAQVPGSAGTAHHHARHAPCPCVFQRDDADIDIALLEDAVRRSATRQDRRRSGGTGRTISRCRRRGPAAGPGARRRAGNRPRACANPTPARRTPSASRVLRSPTAAASARRRPAPAW